MDCFRQSAERGRAERGADSGIVQKITSHLEAGGKNPPVFLYFFLALSKISSDFLRVCMDESGGPPGKEKFDIHHDHMLILSQSLEMEEE